MTTGGRTLHLIGAATDIGAADRGSSMGPDALRVAGLDRALRRLGHEVIDRGNLAGPPNPEAQARDGYRHLAETVTWCQAVHDAVLASLGEGALPILLGGDHSLAIGSIAAVARHCAATDQALSVLWLDAHADFNTPQSSPSGNLHGMPVAVVTGHGPEALLALGHRVPMVAPSQIIQIGIRSVDHQEKAAVEESGITVYDMRRVDEMRMRRVMEAALDQIQRTGGHVHLSFDVDFLDPSVAPGVATTVTGGPTYREAQLAMEMIHDAVTIGSLDIAELNPALDLRNQTAEVTVELIASAFGEQILARHERT